MGPAGGLDGRKFDNLDWRFTLRAPPFGFFRGFKSRVFFIVANWMTGVRSQPALNLWVVYASRQYTKSRTAGLNHSAASCLAFAVATMTLGLMAVAVTLGSRALRPDTLRAETLRSEALCTRALCPVATALGVFGGFQIMNFDVFLVLHN